MSAQGLQNTIASAVLDLYRSGSHSSSAGAGGSGSSDIENAGTDQSKIDTFVLMAQNSNDVLLKLMDERNDLYAINSTYNLSCSTYGLTILIRENMHVKCLKLMSNCKDVAANCAYLHLLVNMSVVSQCVADMLSIDLISILTALVSTNIEGSVRTDASRLLIAIVSAGGSFLNRVARKQVVQIVNLIMPDIAAERSDDSKY